MARSFALALCALGLLTGCIERIVVERRYGGCPLDETMAAGLFFIDLELVEGDCFPRWALASDDSLVPQGCEEVTPADALECGYAVHVRCEGPPLDAVGTRAELDVEGSFAWSVRDGVAGAAHVKWNHPDGWTICAGDYDVSVGPLAP
jgi:hypothetical protein